MGFAAGFQVGASAVERGLKMREERQERERLREAMGLTPQEIAARPPTQEELGRAQAETQARAAEEERMFPTDSSVQNRTGLFSDNPADGPAGAAYAPQMPYVGQMRTAQYRLGDQTLSRMPTQQEIDFARYAAAANVIAERDPVAAMRMRQEQIRMETEAKEAPLRFKGLEQQVALGGQQLETGALTLAQQRRLAEEQQRGSDFAAFAAKNPDMPVAELKDNAFKQFNFTPKQWQETVATRLQIETGEMDIFKKRIAKKLQGKNLTQLGALYNSDPDFDDKTDLAIVPGQGGAVTLNFIDKATKRITGTQTFKNEALATEYLNKQATEPETIGSWMMNLQKAEVGIDKDRAAIEASKSTVSYNAARITQINQMNNALATNLKNSEEAKQIQAQFATLDDTNDPGGSKRQSLITQFNMLSVKAGGTIPTTGGGKKGSVLQTPVDVKKNDDGTYTAFAKDGGQALYNTFNGETIPLGMEVDTYKGMKEAAKKNGVGLVAGEDNGRLVIKFTGADGKFYDDAEKAKYAKPAKAADQPGGLDTSRTTVVQPAAEPTVPTPKPEKRAGEKQTDFRDRLLAWDRNRMAYESLMTEQRLRGQLSGNAAGLRRPLVE